jgi:hypothetical protein
MKDDEQNGKNKNRGVEGRRRGNRIEEIKN